MLTKKKYGKKSLTECCGTPNVTPANRKENQTIKTKNPPVQNNNISSALLSILKSSSLSYTKHIYIYDQQTVRTDRVKNTHMQTIKTTQNDGEEINNFPLLVGKP